MSKPRIQIAIVGHQPHDFNVQELASFRSDAFEIHPSIETYQLNGDAQGNDWEFSDEQFETIVKRNASCDILLILVSVKLECNWYLRRLSDDRAVLTFYELGNFIRYHRIPLKNLPLRMLYAATLIFKRYGNRIPLASEATNYAHDETRGCLFDMNANKADVILSLHQPTICEPCCASLKREGVSNEAIEVVRRGLLKIKKPLADRLIDFIRTHTIVSIFISVASALMIGVAASLMASWLYERM